MDKFTEAEILGTCNALGSEVRGVYEKGTDCLECLRDLLQYLRKSDEDHSVLRFLGSNHLIETDILPILKRYKDEKEIFDFALRLLVALTSPALLLFNEEIPEDKASHNIYLELVGYLQNYKKVFFELDIWKVLYEHLEKRISLRPVERSEEDNLFIERILIIIRNILHIPSDEIASFQIDDNLSPQDKILWNLHLSKIDAIILYLCANEDEYKYCLHVVEILSLMFREHSPELLATTNEIRSGTEKEKDAEALAAIREREQNLKVRTVQRLISSRFNGVYRVKNMKSISDNDYISHKLITDLDEVKFDEKKIPKRKPKNRVPLKEIDITRRSTLSIRLFLKNFCKEFLKSYNKLMAAIKRELLRKSSADHDDTYYLWAIQYFMKFNRHYKFQPALVTETISLQMFHHIQSQITNYEEMMLVDKSKTKIWSKRMCLGVSAYRELLETVFTMTKSKDINIQENANNIVSNVFYVVEYREMLLSLISHFDEVKFSLTYLSELVESVYMFLKMLENHSKKHSGILIQKRKRKIKRRKKKAVVSDELDKESPEELWISIASDLSAAVQGRRIIPSDTTPFDGASELTFEEQKVDAVYKIREALTSKETEQAVGLLRSARELWPEGDSFGAADIDSEDEFDVLREIYLSNLENPHPQNTASVENSEETDEEIESMPAVVEQKLEISDMYKKYASPKVVIPCCSLLANYQSNSSRTNACLIKLLHKIAWDCKMHALFFQSTVFVTFQKIFEDPDASTNPIIKEFYKFAKFILRKFFEVAEKNKKVFVELLFWKGRKEAYELEEGYGHPQPSTARGAWTEEEEEELKYLYEENKDIHIEGQDVADIILANINHKLRTKHQIILALKRLGLIQSAKDLKPHLRKEWTENEIIELQHLYEEFKMSDDMMDNIINGLSIKRNRKAIIEKMLELNLITDRSQTHKKRLKKPKKSDANGSETDSIDNSDLEDQELYENENFFDKKHDVSSGNEDEENFFKNLEKERLDNFNIEGDENIAAQVPFEKEIKNRKQHDEWEEQEIMELRDIFLENQGEDDIMSIILNSLTRKRSKRSIIGKLIEVGLIKDKKEIQMKHFNLSIHDEGIIKGDEIFKGENLSLDLISKSTSFIDKKKSKKARQIVSDSSDDEMQINIEKDQNLQINNFVSSKDKTNKVKENKGNFNISSEKKIRKRAPKVWEEQEIFELQQLFEKHKESNDVIGNIINDQTVKRSKENIIEKLLEGGLIKDRKEVRKKRQSKTTISSDKKRKKKKPENDFKENSYQSKNVHLDLSSSEDETLPLNKLLKSNKNKALLLESSDEELHLNSMPKSIHNETSFASKSTNNKDEPLLNFEDPISKLSEGIKHINGSKKRKKGRILSDSSDEETVLLNPENCIHNSSIYDTTFDENAESKSASRNSINSLSQHSLIENNDSFEPTHLLSTSRNSHFQAEKNVFNSDDEKISSQKRKRFQIAESDNSNDESVLYNQVSKSPTLVSSSNNWTRDGNLEGDNLNAVEEIRPFSKIRKRARVLVDSDESD
ncbi:protein timeless homolog [Caerostris darwini]|uniref:Protein timeless homolog n=1 Tax=Caerostris darwini TaxID=1538125 RepID=A0AAV4W2S8_9ARAC|nr:protein timeless homolog [Caerostris darwini]